MIPLGKVPITRKKSYRDLHIYPGMSGALISWKAAKGLGILPLSYPYPDSIQDSDVQANKMPDSVSKHVQLVNCNPTAEDLINQFPTVLDAFAP